MNPLRWLEIKALFHEAAETPESARSGFLDRRCTDDPTLRNEVERLLRLDSRASRFLDSTPTAAALLRADVEPATRTFQPGDRVCGRFRIGRLLGYGGMGEVYEAADEMMRDLPVALKTIRPGLAWNQDMKERFRSELELSRRVTHANVCRVFDLYQHVLADDREILLLSMELLAGETVSERIRRRGPFSYRDVRPLASQMAMALESAHRAGIIHRDFKSSNVMLVPSRDGNVRVVVMDFGLAQPVPDNILLGVNGKESTFAGTPAYMAPEQLRGQQPTVLSDVYSLGVVLYEMLAGITPFSESRIPEQAFDRQHTRVPEMRPVAPNVPRAWERAILRCLDPDPAHRFSSPSALIAALDAGVGPRHLRRRDAAILSALVLSGASALVLSVDDRLFPWYSKGQRVAVLPFTNESKDSRLNPVAEGLADEVINALSHLRPLQVVARGSSFRGYSASAGVGGIARETHASIVVTGSLRQAEGRIHLSVQLIDPRRQTQKWGDSFERPWQQLSEIPGLVARAVARELGLNLSPPQSAALASRQTKNVEAFNWYLLGRRYAQTRTLEALLNSLDCFDKALRLDPAYALAMSEKAATLVVLAGYPGQPPEQRLPEAETVAQKALRLEPALAEAHLVIGAVEQRLHWNWDRALQQYHMAADAKPNLATAHHWLAGLLSNLGRHKEALEAIRVARDLDPLSVPVHTAYGGILLRSGRYNDAVQQLELAMRMDPGQSNAAFLLSQSYECAGQRDRATQIIRDTLTRQPDARVFEAYLAYLLAADLKTTAAKAIASHLETAWQQKYFAPYAMAYPYVGLGDNIQVFRWLETAWARRDPSVVILKVDPTFASLRASPEYHVFLRRLKLENL